MCLRNSQYFFLFDEKNPTQSPSYDLEADYGLLSPVFDHNRYQMTNIASIPYEKIKNLDENITVLTGETLLMSRFKPDNLMHLLHDDIIPLYATIYERNLVGKLSYIFIDDNWPQWIGQWFFEIFYPEKIYKSQLKKNTIVCFETAHTGK